MIPQKTIDALNEGPKNVESTPTGSLFFDGPNAVNLYRLHVIRASLKLEVNTGMKMSRGVSALRLANDAMGTNFKRKAQALEAMNELLGKDDE